MTTLNNKKAHILDLMYASNPKGFNAMLGKLNTAIVKGNKGNNPTTKLERVMGNDAKARYYHSHIEGLFDVATR